MAKIGDKVVCVDASDNEHLLKQKTVYTILDIVTCPSCGQVCYRLAEVDGTAGSYCNKCKIIVSETHHVFRASRFRLVSYPNLSFKEIAKEEVVERLDVPVKQFEEA